MKSPRSPAARRTLNMRMDRHSGTGTRGLPKKNGAGAKTVWGPAEDQAPVAFLDKNDPNYDSEQDEEDQHLFTAPPDLALAPAPKLASDVAEKQQDQSSAVESSAASSPANSASPLASDD